MDVGRPAGSPVPRATTTTSVNERYLFFVFRKELCNAHGQIKLSIDHTQTFYGVHLGSCKIILTVHFALKYFLWILVSPYEFRDGPHQYPIEMFHPTNFEKTLVDIRLR